MTVEQIRIKEFNKLYNIFDLLPFYKIKSFWNKIGISFFIPLYNILIEYNFNFYYSFIENKLTLYFQKFAPA